MTTKLKTSQKRLEYMRKYYKTDKYRKWQKQYRKKKKQIEKELKKIIQKKE